MRPVLLTYQEQRCVFINQSEHSVFTNQNHFQESCLEQIDEDEWTDRNFGTSTANDMNTSEDSVSDLESDDDNDDGHDPGDDDLERPLTADETRRLQREWRVRYKGRSIATPLPATTPI